MLRITMEQIEKALQALEAGKIVVFPTETSYGIGCDARNVEAVDRIFKIKGRVETKALPLLIPNKESAGEYIKMTKAANALADMFWPGALNIIGEVKEGSGIAPACSMNGTQSVRVSSQPFATVLVKRFGGPVVATSANISGRDAIYRMDDIKEIFENSEDKPDVFIDGGDLPRLPASTTIKLVDEDHVKVLRDGLIKIPNRFL